MNKIIIKGILVKENNFKVSDKGNSFLINSISVTEGKDKKRIDYFNIIAFGEVAETIANCFKKGDSIQIEGKLQNNNYEKDGQKIYRDQIVITNFVKENNSDNTLNDEEFPF